jgi:hypothetical protein
VSRKRRIFKGPCADFKGEELFGGANKQFKKRTSEVF